MHIVFDNTSIDKNLYYKVIYKKDDIVFNDNDICNRIGFLVNGNISIVTNTFSENEYEINNITDNGFFGAYVLFASNNQYLGTGICTKKTEVIYFSKTNLIKAFENHIFLENYLNLIANNTLKIQTKVKILSQKSIQDKIVFLLYDNYKRTKSLTLKIKSKIQFANYLNIPRPSLSRELINLKNKDIIDYNRYNIYLKKAPDYL